MVAAHNATRRYAHHEAITVLEHARELLPNVSHDERAQLELQILHQMGNVFYALGNIDRSADAFRLMATRAAATGLLAVQADALMRLPHAAASIPFFLQALEIEPTFAAAHVNLSRIYSNLGEAAQAKQFAKRAYDLLGHVGERDRLSILYQYHFEVTGNQLRATETLERWKATFPDEYQPVNSLAHINILLGRFERAIDEGHQAIERDPSHGYPYSNLAHAYRGVGRFDDARRVAREAVARGIETLPTRRLLYQLAIISGDEAAAAAHLQWARDKPREFDMVGATAQVLAWSGRVRQARLAFNQCERMAMSLDLAESGHSYLAWAAWMELTYGNIAKARRDAERLLERNPGYDVRLRAALTLALSGRADQAEAIADELTGSNPEHTFINFMLAPVVRAGIELARKQPDRAIERLEPVTPFELGVVAWLAPVYLRAQSFLLLGSAKPAAQEFQRLLNHRGVDPFSPFHATAPIGLARARAMAGDIEGSRLAYEGFLTRWAAADPDIPILREARNESHLTT
jgi:eukaryotic-like serine/threonine-protein kinase